MNESTNEFLKHAKQSNFKLSNEDTTHLQQAKINMSGISTFYCMPKLHKNKTPAPLRPVISTVNTKLHYLGKRSTKILKRATTQVSTCIKDSDDLIKHLKSLGKIEKNEHLFNTDTVAMCPNIDTEEGLAALKISHQTNLVK